MHYKLKNEQLISSKPKSDTFLEKLKAKLKQSKVKHESTMDILEKITGKKFEDWPAYNIMSRKGPLRLYKRGRNNSIIDQNKF